MPQRNAEGGTAVRLSDHEAQLLEALRFALPPDPGAWKSFGEKLVWKCLAYAAHEAACRISGKREGEHLADVTTYLDPDADVVERWVAIGAGEKPMPKLKMPRLPAAATVDTRETPDEGERPDDTHTRPASAAAKAMAPAGTPVLPNVAGAWRYTVRLAETPVEFDGQRVQGVCDSSAKLILISPHIPPEARLEVLLHELGHAWHFSAGATLDLQRERGDYARQERACDLLAAFTVSSWRFIEACGGEAALMALQPGEEFCEARPASRGGVGL